MTAEEIEKLVWEVVDAHALDMSQQEYIDMLYSIAGDANIRAEAVEQEILDNNE